MEIIRKSYNVEELKKMIVKFGSADPEEKVKMLEKMDIKENRNLLVTILNKLKKINNNT